MSSSAIMLFLSYINEVIQKSDTIPEKMVPRNCTYSVFSYHVGNSYLNAHDPICKFKNCFVYVLIIM